MISSLLSLSDAVRLGRMAEFIAQEELRGIGPIDRAEFNRAASRIIKAPLPEDRTSHSASNDGSNETETRQGSSPYAVR